MFHVERVACVVLSLGRARSFERRRRIAPGVLVVLNRCYPRTYHLSLSLSFIAVPRAATCVASKRVKTSFFFIIIIIPLNWMIIIGAEVNSIFGSTKRSYCTGRLYRTNLFHGCGTDRRPDQFSHFHVEYPPFHFTNIDR